MSIQPLSLQFGQNPADQKGAAMSLSVPLRQHISELMAQNP